MKTSYIIIIVAVAFVLISIFWVSTLISPPTSTPTSTPIPSSNSKTFKFSSETNLEAELEKVNPQVLDSDFE